MSASAGYVGLLTTWLNRKFISDLEWALQYQKFSTKALIPPGSGKTGRFNVFAPPPITAGNLGLSYTGSGTTALDETWTTQNEIATITAASTDITVTEYGEFHKTSALMQYAAVPGWREKIRKRLRDGAHVTIDTLVGTQAGLAKTNYLYANADQDGGATTWSTGSVAILGASAIMQARKLLFAKGARGFDGISGHPDGDFAAIITPKQELDIVTEVTTSRVYWNNAVVNVPGKLGQEKWVKGYIGSIYGVACYSTQNYDSAAYTASSTGDIGYVLADGWGGCLSFKDMEPSIVINDVNSPYKNVDSIAWHSFFGAGLIDGPNRVIKMYSAS